MGTIIRFQVSVNLLMIVNELYTIADIQHDSPHLGHSVGSIPRVDSEGGMNLRR
jgi:hypothetical protein